jgi:hypothetical protein
MANAEVHLELLLSPTPTLRIEIKLDEVWRQTEECAIYISAG